MNFENPRQEVERVAESKISPKWHIFVSIVGRKGKRWRSIIKVGTRNYLKNIYLQREWIPKNHRREVECVDESEIFSNRHVFISIVGQEIEERVPFKPLATSPLTVSFLFVVSRVQSAKYIYLRIKCTKSYSN